jgi:hypothetical protein
MAEQQSYFRFREASRPDIGFISDGFQNLSEVFESDKRVALRNIGLEPEVLDSLYRLSDNLSDREDFRFCSGLEEYLLPSLQQLIEVYNYRVPLSLYQNKDYYSPSLPFGGEGSSSVNYPNIILFNGSIQCEGAQYVTNTIGDTIFSSPVRKLVSVSTSRNSLFNSESDPLNVGYYKSASYSGSIRVRRRSHVNRIFLPPNTLLPKPDIVENPSHSIDLYIDNNNTGTSIPIKLLSTKNTPLKVFCRLSKGSIKFTFSDSNSPYFYGFQVQPIQTRPNSPRVDFLPVPSVSQSAGSITYTVNIDISSTGYQNIYDLYLYLYVNPLKVREIEFTNIDIRETPDKKDLGLLGFDNLERFALQGSSMTILPLWLKTLKNKLRVLDLGKSNDLWSEGSMGWFDYRDPLLNPSQSTVQCTAVSYLTIPKRGVFVNESRDGWSDLLFQKYLLNESRIANVDFRQFTSLEELNLGRRFKGYSPRFDDVFPNLKTLVWSNRDTDRPPFRYLFGSLPKIARNGFSITYDIFNSGARGDIVSIGTSTDPSSPDHISRYKMSYFSVGGSHLLPSFETTGYINNPADPDWSEWRKNAVFIQLQRTSVSINLQVGQWDLLVTLDGFASGGAKFDLNSSPLKTPKLETLVLHSSTTEGKLPSLGLDPATETGNLKKLDLGYCNNLTPVLEGGISFLLPSNFAPIRLSNNLHKMNFFSLEYITSKFRFRRNDIINLHELVTFSAKKSSLTGRFPVFPTKFFYESERKSVTIDCSYSDFYDLSTLSVTPSNSYFSKDIFSLSLENCNLSGGGAVLPTFEGVSDTSVSVVKLSNSLPSTYPLNWSVQANRGVCVSNGHSTSEISGLSITKLTAVSDSDSVYILSGAPSLNQSVMVNDSVRPSASGPELAKVLSVSSTEVIISSNIPDPIPSTLYFVRAGINISNWFRSGFSKLTTFSAENCRLTGTLSIRNGFNSITLLNLKQNLISSYFVGSLTRVFSGNNRRVIVDLSNNILPVSEIRNIVQEVITIDKLKIFKTCQVRLSGNKLTPEGKYSNYTQQDIFPTIVNQSRDEVTSLFRNETFQVYNERQVTSPTLGTSFTYTLVGTQTLQFSGALVSGTYYKQQIRKTQSVTEDPLATGFKNLTGISISFGFTYTSPNTSTTTVSISYTNQTTRVGSIGESGLTLLNSCPSPVGSGTCWRNSSNQILKLV